MRVTLDRIDADRGAVGVSAGQIQDDTDVTLCATVSRDVSRLVLCGCIDHCEGPGVRAGDGVMNLKRLLA